MFRLYKIIRKRCCCQWDCLRFTFQFLGLSRSWDCATYISGQAHLRKFMFPVPFILCTPRHVETAPGEKYSTHSPKSKHRANVTIRSFFLKFLLYLFLLFVCFFSSSVISSFPFMTGYIPYSEQVTCAVVLFLYQTRVLRHKFPRGGTIRPSWIIFRIRRSSKSAIRQLRPVNHGK